MSESHDHLDAFLNGAMPTCQELCDRLADFVDHELDPRAVSAIERHLSICPCCVNYLESYRATIRLSQSALRLPAETNLPELPEHLRQALVALRSKL